MTSRTGFATSAAATLSALVAVWGATQWTAHTLEYASALGSPWLEFGMFAIYAPWDLFYWWLTFGDLAPEVFDVSGSIAAAGGATGGAIAIGGAVWRDRNRKVVKTYGSARWADARDVEAAGLFADDGVILGTFGGRYLRDAGPHHTLAVAPTRSGKGVGLVLPTLLSWTGSTVVNDIKGENWTLTAGWRSRFSHCIRFDPTDVSSDRFNPLLEVRRGPFEVRDAQNIADILVDPEGHPAPSSHWDKTAHTLLTGAILHVLYAEPDKTLSRVASLLSDPSQSIETTLGSMMETNHLGTIEQPQVHPVVAAVARELLNKSDNERSSVVSTALTFVAIYRDPVMATVTRESDWRITDVVAASRPISLYLIVPPSDISRTRPLVRLILNQLLRRLTEQHHSTVAQSGSADLLLMLDEFPALGRLEFFETSLAFLAGYGIRAYLIAQSLHQIDRAYGANHSILDNCHVRIAFASNDERTARRVSETLGTKTEQRAQRNFAGHRLAPWLAHTAVSTQETARPLLTAGEVLQLPADKAIVFASGQPPILADKLRYFEDRNFVARQLSPPSVTPGRHTDLPRNRPHDWSGRIAGKSPATKGPGTRGPAANSGRREQSEPVIARDRTKTRRQSHPRSYGFDDDQLLML